MFGKNREQRGIGGLGSRGFITDGNAQNEDSRMLFSSIPGLLQTVQSAELWGVVLSLEAFVPVFIGIDNPDVFNFVSKLLDGSWWFQPLPLHKDGDLVAHIQGKCDEKGRYTVKVAKVFRPCY